jgi:hypothetical protein
MILVGEFEISGLPRTINQIGRAHWAIKAKEAKLWKYLVLEQCVYHRLVDMRLHKAELEFTRISSREPDFDNLASSFKHVMDGLVMAKVIIDDKPSVIGSPTFKWEKASRKEVRVKVRIFKPD